jgi:hypothetical protein
MLDALVKYLVATALGTTGTSKLKKKMNIGISIEIATYINSKRL